MMIGVNLLVENFQNVGITEEGIFMNEMLMMKIFRRAQSNCDRMYVIDGCNVFEYDSSLGVILKI